MNNKKYNQYKHLKGLIDGHEFKGYPLHLVLGSYLAFMVWQPSLVGLVRYVFLNVKGLFKLISNETVYTLTIDRKDYRNLVNRYFPHAKPVMVNVENTKKELVMGIPSTVINIIRAILYSHKINCSFSERLYLIVALSIAFKVINELEKQEIICDKYVAFNSSFLIESFISFYFRKRGVKTYSLQHGMYFKYASSIPIDIINYENVCADVLLLWGGYTESQISKYLPREASSKVYGYPVTNGNSDRSQVEDVLILLPRDIYWAESKMLLTYLSNYNFNFVVRPHPSVLKKTTRLIEGAEKFTLDTNTILNQTLSENKKKAVVAFNSTAVFEACLHGQFVLFFSTGNQEFLNPGFDQFDVDSDFCHVISGLSTKINHEQFFSDINYCL